MKDTILDLFGQGGTLIQELKTTLKELIDLLPAPGPNIVEVMAYSDAIEYFVRNAPADLHVSKGVMLRQSHPRGYLFIQVFLDSQNNLLRKTGREDRRGQTDKTNGKLYGRRLIVEQFDRELSDLFGDKDLILVE
jgi:transcription antitermination factor NusA-like protein